MTELKGSEIKDLYVGRKVFFKNEYDEIPFIYDATIVNIHPYQIELECIPIPESVTHTVVPALMKTHVECISKADMMSSDSRVHIYKGLDFDRDYRN